MRLHETFIVFFALWAVAFLAVSAIPACTDMGMAGDTDTAVVDTDTGECPELVCLPEWYTKDCHKCIDQMLVCKGTQAELAVCVANLEEQRR